MAVSRRMLLKAGVLGIPFALGHGTAWAAPVNSAVGETSSPTPTRWTVDQAKDWQTRHGWLVGCNYIPSTAVNQLEMFAADTFDTATITKELGWAQGLGMNCVRVFLHDKLWAADSVGFTERIDSFLSIANGAGIKTMLVLFDSCWDPEPKLGPQPAPRPGIHNSRWVQSPGAEILSDDNAATSMKAYVTGVVGAFANDARVVAWDVWNEPDNLSPAYALLPSDKISRVTQLLPQVFDWARSVVPSQPLTSATWSDTRPQISAIQLGQSDIITFHNYEGPQSFQAAIDDLVDGNRPILCTEYMARTLGSTIPAILPIAQKAGVGVMNWGLVAGRTQTYLPWNSWDSPYVDGREPDEWFHDLLHDNGTPYDNDEAQLLRSLAPKPQPKPVEPAPTQAAATQPPDIESSNATQSSAPLQLSNS